MITKLKARYEAHQDTEIELDPGLTVILGPNDTGKSAINRSLTWVSINLPKGDSMLPWSPPYRATVTIEADGNTVTRTKGPSNIYEVNGTTLRAIGNGVPEEVTDALRLDSINLQKQVDQYYILQWSAGDVAKHINQLAGIEESDLAIKRTNELIRESDKEIKKLKDDIKNKDLFLETHSYAVESAGAYLSFMLSEESYINATTNGLSIANALVHDLRNSESNLKGFPNYEEADQRINDIESMGQVLGRIAARNGAACVLRDSLRAVQLERFDVLDQASIEDMEELHYGIEKGISRHLAMKNIADELRSIDLDKYEVAADNSCNQLLQETSLLYDNIVSEKQLLNSAEQLMKDLKSVDIGKYRVLNTASTTPLDQLNNDIFILEKKLGMLKDLRESEIEIDKLYDYLEICENELAQIEEQCPTCGQTVRGADVANHLHS